MMQKIAAPRRQRTAQSLQATDITSNTLHILASQKRILNGKGTFAEIASYRPYAMVLEGSQAGAVHPSEQRDEAIAPLLS